MADRLLVTGGAGFIGSNFARLALQDEGVQVTVLDKLTYAGHPETIGDLGENDRFSFVQGDIGDPQLLQTLLADLAPDAVLNFAAESHVDRSIDGPAAFIETNIVGVFRLLEAVRDHLRGRPEGEQRGFRFLQVSTDEVYGSLGATGSFREDDPYDPRSPYAASKAAADHLVSAYVSTYGVPAVITNCSNNYGPYQFPEKLIPLMTLNALDGRPLPIYGDGKNVRDWIHVEDHCRGVQAVLRRGRIGRTYNIGADAERTNLQIVEGICEALERVRPAAGNDALRAAGAATYGDLVTHVPDRPGHDRRYAIDASRIRSELDWKPRQGFEVGLEQTVTWYVDNRAWCAAVQQGTYDRERLGSAESA